MKFCSKDAKYGYLFLQGKAADDLILQMLFVPHFCTLSSLAFSQPEKLGHECGLQTIVRPRRHKVSAQREEYAEKTT